MNTIRVLEAIPSSDQIADLPTYTDITRIKEHSIAKKPWFKTVPSLVYILRIDWNEKDYGYVHWAYVERDGRIGMFYYVTSVSLMKGEPFLKINPFWTEVDTQMHELDPRYHKQYFE